MNEIINWLLGLDPSTEILTAGITFRYPVPMWLVAFVVILIAVYCHWIYKKEAAETGRFYRGLMAFFRFLTWVAILFVILQPKLDLDFMSQPKSNLAILIDTSKSMTLTDKSANQDYYAHVQQATKGFDKPIAVSSADKKTINDSTRYQILKQILSNEKLDLVKRLEEKYALHFFTFDESTHALETLKKSAEDQAAETAKTSSDANNANESKATAKPDHSGLNLPEPSGDTTQLGTALRRIPNELRGLPISAIIPFTDGANNRGESSTTAAQWLGGKNIPVYPVGIGAPEAVDIGIVNIDLPDLIFKDDEIAVRVTFEASSLDDVVLPITLMLGEKEVGTGEAVAKEGVFQADFVITPKEIGDLVFKVSVPQQNDEIYVENNTLNKRIRVIDSAIRILIAVDTPNWEYRYLKGFLATDKRIITKTFIRRGDQRSSATNDSYLERFPSYEELQTKYDCVIFNNITADYFSDKQMRDIAKYVSEDGGSFIMLSSTKGTPGTFIDTPIGEMLPVTLSKVSEDEQLDVENQFTTPYNLRLTRDGYNHVITRLSPLPEKNAEIWSHLPSQYWYYTGIKRLKPSALSLVEHASKRNTYGPIPLMAIQRYGRGNVLFSGFNSVWRWRYKIGNKYTNRFWGQTIQYMGLPHLLGNMKRVNFQTQGRDFSTGEKIPVSVHVLDRDFRPVKDQQVVVQAHEEATAQDLSFTFPLEEDKQGSFAGKMFLPDGTWHVTVAGYEKEDEMVLDIKAPQFEFESPAMRIKELQAVAAASGGAYISLDQVWTLPDLVSESTKKMRSQLKKDLWDTWLTLLFIVCTCAIEWILRKRIDLA